MQEIIHWQPFKGFSGRFYCEGVHDDYEGFRIIMRHDDKEQTHLRLKFEDVLFYQNTDEGNFLNPPPYLGDFNFPHPFYVIENSKLVQDFHQLSSGIYQDDVITHFAIYSANDCIDILTLSDPVAEILGI